MGSIGSRVRQCIAELSPPTLHRDIARDIDMTTDALSRSVNDERRFSSIELARLADRLGADLHWLITGRSDPHRLVVAARHDFDRGTGRRSVPGAEGDARVLDDIALAYRQAYPAGEVLPALPSGLDRTREALGPDFVRPFAERLEERVSVDVVRVSELSTAYSFTVGGRRVIAIPATGNWFFENWSMAHELGHLVLGHHDVDSATDPRIAERHEADANSFAADLLLPAQDVRATTWDGIAGAAVAQHVWNWGVSTLALATRVRSVTGRLPESLGAWTSLSTQSLLRRHLAVAHGVDEITPRMRAAAGRRFPLHLEQAHLRRVATGELGKGTLAWMLGIDAGHLDVDEPVLPQVGVDELATALGH